MRIDAIEIGKNPPEDINAIIEVSIGGEPIKYEMDKAAGTLVVDRFLYTPMRYPGNYGFVPHTLSEDGDPIDVLVCNTRPLVESAIREKVRRENRPWRARRRRPHRERGRFPVRSVSDGLHR
jgi:inorganic pyrophosphatase